MFTNQELAILKAIVEIVDDGQLEERLVELGFQQDAIKGFLAKVHDIR
jgi:hypothetical protein